MKSFQELREKTLTPAEKKKREEIAKAIERDDPGMDMSKKMAIATAQAKKVAEEVDEAVKARPTDAALYKTLGPTKHIQQGVEALKKAHGFTTAQAKGHINRLMNQIAKSDKTQKEEVEEGLQQKLRKYVPGYAKKQIDKKMDAQKFGRTDVDKDANYWRYKKVQDKLKKEEVEQVAELDDKTVKSYHQKAMKDTMLGKKDRNAGMSKALNRMSGLGKPLMKGPNEETVAEARYKMVDGKKMRWDDVKKMWTPVKDMFHMEQDKKETPPFDGPYKKVKSVVPGKQGEGPSTAKHLAKMGLKKFMAKGEKK